MEREGARKRGREQAREGRRERGTEWGREGGSELAREREGGGEGGEGGEGEGMSDRITHTHLSEEVKGPARRRRP